MNNRQINVLEERLEIIKKMINEEKDGDNVGRLRKLENRKTFIENRIEEINKKNG